MKIIFDDNKLAKAACSDNHELSAEESKHAFIITPIGDNINIYEYVLIDNKVIHVPSMGAKKWWCEIRDWRFIRAVPVGYWATIPSDWVEVEGDYSLLEKTYRQKNLSEYKRRIVKRLKNKMSEYYRLSLDNYTVQAMKDFLLGTFTPEDLVKYKERVAVADKLFDKFKIARSGIQVATTVDKIHEIEKEFLGHVTYFTNAPYGLDGETLRSFK